MAQSLVPEWEEKYSISNEKMDEQHKVLFEIAKKAENMINKQVSPQELKMVAIEMFFHIKSHFFDEEEYMAEIGYPRLEEHREIHRQIMIKSANLIKNMKHDFKEKLAIVMKDWVITHIMQEDKKIEAWCKENLEVKEDSQMIETITKYMYKCACRELFEVSLNIHNKITNGGEFYCKRCNENIIFVEMVEECSGAAGFELIQNSEVDENIGEIK